MTAQQALVGLTDKNRLGTYGVWALLLVGAVVTIYAVTKSAGLVR